MLKKRQGLEQLLSLNKLLSGIFCVGLAMSFASIPLHADTWKKIDNPEEIHQLIADKALDGKYWRFYLRSDGKMAYEQGGFTSIREWQISADGAICMNILAMADKSLGCEILSRKPGTPVEYRLEGKTGKTKIQIIEPDQAIIDAVTEEVGKIE